MRANIVLIFCVSILLGILLPFFIDFNFNESLLFLVLAFTFFVLLVFKTNANKKYLLFFFTVFLGLFLGCLSTVNTSNKNSILLEKNLNKKIKVEGVVDDFPDERQGHTFLVVKVEDKNFHTNERIILTTPIYPKHYFGERVQIEGKLEQPVNTFKNKEGDLDNQVFSYRGYLSKDNIYTSMYYPSIETVESPKKSVKYFLYNFKARCIKIVQEYIKDPASGLLVGILFGVKQALGSDILSEFTKAGVVHIVVLSGYNIALIVSASLAFFSRTPLHVKYFLTYCG